MVTSCADPPPAYLFMHISMPREDAPNRAAIAIGRIRSARAYIARGVAIARMPNKLA